MSQPEPYFPMRYGLRQKRRVWRMAKTLGRSVAEVCGALGFVWEFAHEQLPAFGDRVPWCDASDIDRLAEIPGFALAMVEAEYLKLGDGWAEFIGYNDVPKGPGSHAYHETQKKKRTAHATAQRAADRAKEEQATNPENVTTNVTDNVTLNVTTDVTMNVTDNVTKDNNKYNNNTKNNIFPPSPVPGADPKPPFDSHLSGNPGHRPSRHERRSDRILQLLSLSPAEPWARWVQHLADLHELPSMETARIWAQRVDRLPIGESGQLIAKAIERGWYTLDGPSGGRPEKAPAKLPDSGSQGSGECPRPYPTPNGSPMREGQDWYWRDKATGARWRFSKVSGKWVGA